MTSFPIESEVPNELDEELCELTEVKNLTYSIHMPNLNQIDDSNTSFNTNNFANNSLIANNKIFTETEETFDVKTERPLSAAVQKETSPQPEEEETTELIMPDTHHIKFQSNSEIQKPLTSDLNNNSLWNDHCVAVKSQTQLEWPPERLAAKNLKNSQIDFNLNSPSNYFQGEPVINGGYSFKINPATSTEFSYMNRNKTVNRRLAIRKHVVNSIGLPTFGSTGSDINLTGKNSGKSDFALGSEKMLNELKEIEQNSNTQSAHCLQDNSENLQENIKPDTYGYYKNISSNVVENIKPGKLKSKRAANKVKIPAKSSSIIVLEREKSRLPDEEPSPASYHIPRRPLNEKNSPVYTIGKRCFNEKGGGGRLSWEKEWFNSKTPYTIKADFRRELFWPTPNNYRIKSTIGIDSNKAVFYQYPNHSISASKVNSAKHHSTSNPASAPTAHDNCGACHHTKNIVLSRDDLIEKDMKKYNVIKDFNVNDQLSARDQLELNVNESSTFTRKSAPKVGLKFRDKGTELWPQVEKTPGPGAYDHSKFNNTSRFTKTPQFSVGQSKNQLNFNVGPYAAL